MLMRLHCGRTSGLEVTQPFDILDLNGDCLGAGEANISKSNQIAQHVGFVVLNGSSFTPTESARFSFFFFERVSDSLYDPVATSTSGRGH